MARNDEHLQDDEIASPEEQAELWAKAQKTRFAMVTTRTAGGMLSSRPMTLQGVDDDGTMWFFSASDTQLGADIRRDPSLNVAFANTNDDFYLAAAGTGHFVDDRQKIESLWGVMASAWFDGPSDPNLWLLRVYPERVDYWKSGAGKLVQMAAMVKAAMTNTRPGKSVGERGSFTPAS